MPRKTGAAWMEWLNGVEFPLLSPTAVEGCGFRRSESSHLSDDGRSSQDGSRSPPANYGIDDASAPTRPNPLTTLRLSMISSTDYMEDDAMPAVSDDTPFTFRPNEPLRAYSSLSEWSSIAEANGSSGGDGGTTGRGAGRDLPKAGSPSPCPEAVAAPPTGILRHSSAVLLKERFTSLRGIHTRSASVVKLIDPSPPPSPPPPAVPPPTARPLSCSPRSKPRAVSHVPKERGCIAFLRRLFSRKSSESRHSRTPRAA